MLEIVPWAHVLHILLFVDSSFLGAFAYLQQVPVSLIVSDHLHVSA